MRRPHHLHLCSPAPRLVGAEVFDDIAQRWDRWHPYDRPFGCRPWLDHLDPDQRVLDMAEWFADRAWDELVALGVISEFRNFTVFPSMTNLWWTLMDMGLVASMPTVTPDYVPGPVRRSWARRRRTWASRIHLVE